MFVIIGVIGAILLLIFLVFGDVLDGLIPESDWLSPAAIATFLVAFGFGAYLVDTGTGLPTPVAAAVGLAAGIGLGLVALRWTRALSDMSTDATPTANDLVGREGRVVTAVPAGSTGEILVRLAGQQVKLTAVAGPDQAGTLEQGTEVVVVEVVSSTRVQVRTAADFWSS
ncbi:MAG: NfeD family protein [Actinomycetota bacterium]